MRAVAPRSCFSSSRSAESATGAVNIVYNSSFARDDFVAVVLTLTHRYNAVRGHRTGSNSSGVEEGLRQKQTQTASKKYEQKKGPRTEIAEQQALNKTNNEKQTKKREKKKLFTTSSASPHPSHEDDGVT